MTEATPEPSNADLLAFMQSAFTHLATEISGVRAEFAEGQESLVGRLDALEDRMLSRFDQVRADVAGVKVDVAMLERHQRDTAEALRRHVHDPDAHRRAA